MLHKVIDDQVVGALYIQIRQRVFIVLEELGELIIIETPTLQVELVDVAYFASLVYLLVEPDLGDGHVVKVCVVGALDRERPVSELCKREHSRL